MRGKEEKTLLRPGGSQNPPGRFKSWFKLCIGIAALWFLTYVVGPFVDNLPWINQRDGTLRESALLAGVAVTGEGKAEASMGVDAGDFDPAVSFIDDSGINTPAFYYTGVEEVGEAVVHIRNSLEYPPKEQ